MKGKRPLFIFLILLLGCGPTYPKEKVQESIVKLCRDEHGIDVRAKIVGKTLGVEVELENLVDETLSVSQEAAEVVKDVVGCTSRVIFSTDRDIDFYLIRAIDTGPLGVEWTMISYVDDIKKLDTYNISLGEYSQRRLSDLRFNPKILGEKVVEKFVPGVEAVRSKRTSLDQALVYCRAQGSEYLILVDAQDFPEVIKEIRPLSGSSLEDVSSWHDEFFLEEIGLADFLAEQIARRISSQFKEDKLLSRSFEVGGIQGVFDEAEGTFRFSIEARGEVGSTGVLEAALKTIAHVLRGYNFSDFGWVQISDLKSRQTLLIDRAILEQYQRRKIDLIQLKEISTLPNSPPSM